MIETMLFIYLNISRLEINRLGGLEYLLNNKIEWDQSPGLLITGDFIPPPESMIRILALPMIPLTCSQ